jgi:hypothetical protein
MKQIPKIGSVAAESKNTAKCKCGAVAKFKTTVEVNVCRVVMTKWFGLATSVTVHFWSTGKAVQHEQSH